MDKGLCFPLYIVSKEIVRKYNNILKDYDLTYTQYITMLMLWESDNINIKELGDSLLLDSGTLTPLLKKMENKGYIQREKCCKDSRNIYIKLTENGKKLKNKCNKIHKLVSDCIDISSNEKERLISILSKMIDKLKEENL